MSKGNWKLTKLEIQMADITSFLFRETKKNKTLPLSDWWILKSDNTLPTKGSTVMENLNSY